MKIDLARVCEKAGVLANRNGLDGLSMSGLAEALNIRTPSLYSHVAGIADVRRRLALHGLVELERGAARSTIGKSGPEALRALLNGYRNWARKNPGIYAATVPTPDPSDREWRAAADRLSETCLAAIQGYDLPGDTASHALRALRSVVHGFVSLEAAGAMRGAVARDESFNWLIDSFLVAMEHMAVRGSPVPGDDHAPGARSGRPSSGSADPHHRPESQKPEVES